MNIRTVTPEEAYHHCNADEFPFETTAEVEELTRYIGQDRALEAVEFGISMRHRGFNLFVIGPKGSGRHSVVQSFINRQAEDEPTPMDGKGKPMDIEAFRKVPKDTQEKIERDIEKLHDSLQKTVHRISILNREAKEQKRKLKEETASLCVAQLIDTLRAKYAEQEKILHYLNCVEKQLIENVDDFPDPPETQSDTFISFISAPPSFDQYDVNVLITHVESGAPVVYEDLPTYQNPHGTG